MKRLLFDEEADGFLEEVSTLHCIGAQDVDTGEKFSWGPTQLPQALETMDQADMLIGHNIIRYDLPVLVKLKQWRPRPQVIIRDTLIIARLKYPNIRETDAELVIKGVLPRVGSDDKSLIGRHNLEAWGYRLGEQKTHYTGAWSVWTQEMQDYMDQDVVSNVALWKHLDPDKYSQAAIELEHRIAALCDLMEREGCPFDMEAAGKLHAEWVCRKDEIERELREQFTFWLAPDGIGKGLRLPKVKPNVKSDPYFWWAPDSVEVTVDEETGKKVKTPVYNDKVIASCGKTFTLRPAYSKLKRVDFNPGSRDHIIKVLTDRGWHPTEFTDAGKPQVNESVVAGLLLQFPEAKGLAEYLMLDKRLSQLAEGEQAWLKNVGPDGHVHGVINPMGTVTSRASHFNPNLGQVPSPKKPYGIECRGLFGKKEGWVLVGADMEGLELRGLAHFLALTDGGKYAQVVTTGDPHWVNACAFGLVPMGTKRDKHSQLHTVLREDGSKRLVYAIIYGCWDDKAGEIVYRAVNNARVTCGDEGEALYREMFGKGVPGPKVIRKIGKKAREGMINRIDGLKDLTERLAAQVKRGFLPGLDGRRIPVRSSHSALNFMIQSAGAVLCKRWGCDAFDELQSKFKIGWTGDVVPMLWVHDEYQVACREGLEEEVGSILVKHARSAGEAYGFRVPLDSKYTVGRTWAETH